MTKKHLTEKQAWMLIARAFSGSVLEDLRCLAGYGLCFAAIHLCTSGTISSKTKYVMLARVKFHKENHFPKRRFFWPTDFANRPKRAALARQFAEECKK